MTRHTLAIKVGKAAERKVKTGHPWVFEDSITKLSKPGQAGDIVIIFDNRHNQFMALGLYDPSSIIRVKVLTTTNNTKIDKQWFEQKINKALSHRKPLENTTNAYRLIAGENDGMPSLICDNYAGHLVVKLYSPIWLPYLEDITDVLTDLIQPLSIILRYSRNMKNEKVQDGAILFGELESSLITFHEAGVNFQTDIIKGHKTGFFLDHRQNRIRTQELAKGKKVLDVFSYAAGFSCHALVGGANEVTSLDISAQALKQARKNGEINQHNGNHICLAGDAFQVMTELDKEKKKYDLIIIDPPSFTPSEKQKSIALKKYAQLAELGINLLAKKGILVLASCSSRISSSEFFACVELVMDYSYKNFTCLEKTYHDIDHPIAIEEAAYLKCGYYQSV